MGYIVNYDSSGDAKIIWIENEKKRKQIRTVVCAILIVAVFIYAAANHWVRDIFLPGYDEATDALVYQMLQDIRKGEDVGSVVTAFCRDVIANAK